MEDQIKRRSSSSVKTLDVSFVLANAVGIAVYLVLASRGWRIPEEHGIGTYHRRALRMGCGSARAWRLLLGRCRLGRHALTPQGMERGTMVACHFGGVASCGRHRFFPSLIRTQQELNVELSKCQLQLDDALL